MQKSLLYIGAFIALVLLQIFLLDNISLSVFFHPMIYVAFVIMLPLDYKPLSVLLLSVRAVPIPILNATAFAPLKVLPLASTEEPLFWSTQIHAP